MTIMVLGGCSKAHEEGCHKTYEISCNDIQSRFIESQFVLNVPRRAPAIFRIDENNICIIGGCSAKTTHLNTMESMNLNQLKWKLSSLENVFDEKFSCAAFCTLQVILF